jgi:hypothetical protein
VSRPFLNFRIPELETEFTERRGDVEFLEALVDELGYRSTERARQLKDLALQALGDSRPATPSPVAKPPALSAGPQQSRPDPILPRGDGGPAAVLDAWTTLEVLSPQTFRRPEDLAGGDRKAVASLEGECLPWEEGGEKPRPKTKLFYQIILGTVDFGAAVSRLLGLYEDTRTERPTPRGEAILAAVVVDRQGRLVEAPAAALSSFAWGIPWALRGELAALAGWPMAEKDLVEELDEILRPEIEDEESEEEPVLDRATLAVAYEWLVARLGLPPDLVAPPRFAIRCYEYYKSLDPPEPLLLNSFYLGDLAMARGLCVTGRATPNLRRYLGVEAPAQRLDLLRDGPALEAAVAPGKIPPARWPGAGRHPLVLLQQAAVNLALADTENSGILAVNGPPGTGKTTLLRDLAAAIVTARAEAMAGFDDPVQAFKHSGEKLKAGSAWLHLYRLSSKLKGFEMLVASSNNKAVENVSAELPERKNIAEDLREELRYFRTLSDAMRERETWGLIAAILGNAANRNRFKKTFWWDEDFGLSTYLAEAAGTPQQIDVIDHQTGSRGTRRPRIVLSEDPPASPEEAMERWRRAQASFRAALARSRRNLQELEKGREQAAILPKLAQEEIESAQVETAAKADEERDRSSLESEQARLAEARKILDQATENLAAHHRAAPGFVARLFRTRPARDWSHRRTVYEEARKSAQASYDLVSASAQSAERHLRESAARRQAAETRHGEISKRYAAVRQEVDAARQRLGASFIDREFHHRPHAEKHTTAPWLTQAEQRDRDAVFVAAVALHKAFIDVAAKPLRHNLGVLMNTFGGSSLPTPEKRALMADLWASLFLVVPVVSTTFASVERMLRDLPLQGIGWLFVDEAGQALPQAAVGAVLRTRRAVVVGDPVQIEPIVTLPDTLTAAICQQFGADPDRYNAPNASVQTLADAATPFMAEFHDRLGTRTVGVPLLVHRRCSEPMFGISNAIAYDRQMVQVKPESPSRIGEILGPSAWFDVQGSAAEKWCPEEGEKVLFLLRSLAEAEIVPDLYLITPFVVVADNLRRLVRTSGALERWTEDPWKWVTERIGTVHTVQGREAEAVILILGAPTIQQTGARGWAGGFPNLLNVAVTRAKERLYVVGNRSLWRQAGLFRELDARLPRP